MPFTVALDPILIWIPREAEVRRTVQPAGLSLSFVLNGLSMVYPVAPPESMPLLRSTLLQFGPPLLAVARHHPIGAVVVQRGTRRGGKGVRSSSTIGLGVVSVYSAVPLGSPEVRAHRDGQCAGGAGCEVDTSSGEGIQCVGNESSRTGEVADQGARTPAVVGPDGHIV